MSQGIQPQDVVADYCDLNGVFQAVCHKKFSAASSLIDQAMKKVLEDGYEPEELDLIVNCFLLVLQYDIFYQLLDELGCELGETFESRAAMCAEYENWKKSGEAGGAAWLIDENGAAAHPAVKIRVFRSLDALYLSASAFDEVPRADVMKPKCQKKTYGEFEMVTIADAEIVDDGGFLADEKPAGKDFTLRDADGVIYHLNQVRRSRVPGDLDLEGGKHYTAEGTIEGYTGAVSRQIEFEVFQEDDRSSFVFSYSTEGTDDGDTPVDPRWADYESWIEKRIAAHQLHKEAFLSRYTES